MADESLNVPAPEPGERNAGYCVFCDAIVEICEDGSCCAGHPAEAVAGCIPLGDGGLVPSLPRFNWAAFALPPVWGPAHGQWAGLFFLPIWLFADSAVESAAVNSLATTVAVLVLLLTVAFQAFFAKRANGVAWRRVCANTSPAEFARQQRVWAFWCVPVGAVLLGWAVYYRFF